MSALVPRAVRIMAAIAAIVLIEYAIVAYGPFWAQAVAVLLIPIVWWAIVHLPDQLAAGRPPTD